MDLQQLLREILTDDLTIDYDVDFGYDVENETVLIPVDKNTEIHSDFARIFFDDICERYADAVKYSIYYWSLMHEVGHFYTIDDIEEDDTPWRIVCNALGIESMKMYMRLPSEFAATEWAINWTQNFPELSQKINEFVT